MDRIVEKPQEGYGVVLPSNLDFAAMNYPEVEVSQASVVVRQSIGNIKHHIPTYAFRVPLRVVLRDELAGNTVEMTLQVFGRNLVNPLTEQLRIKVVSPS